MPELHSATEIPSNPKQDPAEFLRRLKETSFPLVITLNGEAELVIKTDASFQKLLEIAEREDLMETLRLSIEDVKAGRVVPWEEVQAELEEIISGSKAKTAH